MKRRRGEEWKTADAATVVGGKPNLTQCCAISYLKDVKERFEDEKGTYADFMQVMKDFKSQRIDTYSVIERVQRLFSGHPDLIVGFNTFLPEGHEIILPLDEKKPADLYEAVCFVGKLRTRLQNDDDAYRKFLYILQMHREGKPPQEVISEVSMLLEDHQDLLGEFARFHPGASTLPNAYHEYFDGAFSPHDARTTAQIVVEHDNPVDKNRERTSDVHLDNDLHIEPSILEHDKWIKRSKKDRRDRRRIDCALDTKDFGQCYGELNDMPHKLRRFSRADDIIELAYQYGDKTESLGTCSVLSSPQNDQNALKRHYLGFIGKGKKVNDHKYTEIGNDGFCDSEKGIKRENTSKMFSEDTTRCKASFSRETCMAISELDLSNCQRCTPSYYRLPKNYRVPSSSHRSKLGASVLNDVWVSSTSGSDDYSFKHRSKNCYEETLFRCEDDRFEMDMLLEMLKTTASQLEKMLKDIQEKREKPEDPTKHLSAMHLRCIKRLYGDRDLETIESLRKNPNLALPVILTCLKRKQEELLRCRTDFNKVWAETYATNHHKSLDHRSFYFKQQDPNKIGAKACESADIKECSHKDKEEEVVEVFDAHDAEGELRSSPISDCFPHSVKPLVKYMPLASHDKKDKVFRIFYGTKSFFLPFRLHQILYERILSAKTNWSLARRKWMTSKDTSSSSLYHKNNCRTTIGTESYIRFILDKLIYKVVKQLHEISSNDIDNKLLLHACENSRYTGKMADLIYHDNVRIRRGGNIIHFESSSDSSCLSVQLVGHGHEKLVTAVWMDANFNAYLYNDLLSSVLDKKVKHNIFIGRNKLKNLSSNEHYEGCEITDDIQTFNGLECKVSYVLDTEDTLYRKKRRTGRSNSSVRNQTHSVNVIYLEKAALVSSIKRQHGVKLHLLDT